MKVKANFDIKVKAVGDVELKISNKEIKQLAKLEGISKKKAKKKLKKDIARDFAAERDKLQRKADRLQADADKAREELKRLSDDVAKEWDMPHIINHH